ncbi:MAG: hypothetical protein K8I00_09430 [Candidatus Omnitrophica bacterium]|nr:hypothetical protein [Candidatus Omnitrophota bacterium]
MPNRKILLIVITLLVSLCSICYELLLAQALSLFLRNTVLRYCVTIGLYLFAMGLGARSVEGKMLDQPRKQLLRVEILLTAAGGFLMLWLYGMDYLLGAGWLFSLLAHALILIIGYLTGMELPILMELMKEDDPQAESRVLAFSYFGAVLGTFVFAFIYYPLTGLLTAAFVTGMLNGCAGLLTHYIDAESDTAPTKSFYAMLYLQLALFVMMCVCLMFVPGINEFCLRLYLNQGV